MSTVEQTLNELSASELVSNHFQTSLESWKWIGDELERAFATHDDAQFKIQRPATKFILTWMRELKGFQKDFGTLFGRQKRPPMADDYTAAVGFCLERFLATKGFHDSVRSEKTTHRQRGATRPDISVWLDDSRLVASVECKTDFGWSRERWKENWEERARDLASRSPECVSYLCVLTKNNWDAAEFESSLLFRKQWFCLSNRDIGKLPTPIADTDILTPIEEMFLDIGSRLQTASGLQLEGST